MMAAGGSVSDVAIAPKIAHVIDPVLALQDDFLSGLSSYRAAYKALKTLA